MIRRPPRSTHCISSAASDVYKRQASSRYGIHGAEGEGFGIAIAEMVKAGCVTFAPAVGGPAEILDHET